MKKSLFTLFICILSLSAFAQKINKGTFETKYNAVADAYDFWLYKPSPEEYGNHPMPLLIYLHGASCCGYDINKVMRYGTLDAIKRGKIVPAMVIAPQNHGGAWKPEKINRILEWAERHYSIDKSRIYVLGMSLGGYGTMDFVCAYPEKVAAAMALCGGCSSKNMDGMGQVPMWIIHGTADRAVAVSCSKRVVSYLEENNLTKLLRYDWVAGGSHGLLARCFYMQKTYDWLFTHSLDDRPRSVDKSFNIDDTDYKNTYQELKWFKGMFEND